MEQYSIVIILLAVAIGLSSLATKIKIPNPILLLTAGIIVGFIPGFHEISINPDVVFLIFLPPMLYDAAFTISFKDFRANIHTISALAITLIFITTIGIAVLVYYCIPDITWSLAFVLGAILSPPDAIAATGITKGLGLPHRTSTILEGESLVNDASALVAFRIAVAAVAGSAFNIWDAGILFIISMAGGILIGWLIWIVFAFLIRKQRLQDNVTVSLNIMLPFVAYLIAEEIHVSGVIAVVTSGLILSAHKDKLSVTAQIQSKSIWNTIIFILSGLIFLLIGLEFPHILENIPHNFILPLIGCSCLIFITALVIRMVWVLWDKKTIDKRIATIRIREATLRETINNDTRVDILKRINTEKANRKIALIRRNYIKTQKRLNYLKEYKSLTYKECVIIGWSGMRGIVSLAAALSLPLTMENGSVFPYRSIIIFLTAVTVILMLLIQGLGLPLILKLLKVNTLPASNS